MTRTMVGYSDLTSARFGTVLVTGMSSRHPAPRWACVCTRCGTRWSSEAHTRLVNAGHTYRCQNTSCAAQHEAEQRHVAVHGVPVAPSPERNAVQSMTVDENNVGLLRAGIQGITK